MSRPEAADADPAHADPQRVLLLVPTKTYRAEDFLAAALELGVEVTVGSEEPSSVEHLEPGRLLTLPLSDPARAAAVAVDFAARHPLAAVVGVDDGAAEAAAEVARALGLPHNPPEAVRAARDKLRMRRLLDAGGVAQPGYRTLPLDAVPLDAPDVSFPCVVKPTHLAASRGVLRADDPDQLEAALERLRALLARGDVGAGPDGVVLVEDYVPGPEVALEGLLEDGVLRVLAVFDKPDPLEGPTFAETLYVTPSRRPAGEQARMAALTQAATRALGLIDGPVHAELRGEGDGLRFIEVAARTIGGLCSRALRFGVGVSLEELVLRRALRLDLPELSTRCASGVLMVHAPRAGTFRELRGAPAARAVAGIEDVVVRAHRGQQLEPLPEGAVYVAFAFARGETPAEVEASLRAADAVLEVVLDG